MLHIFCGSWSIISYCCCYCCSVANSCLTLWKPMTATHQASLSFTIFQSLLKFMSIELMMPSNHLILCHPFILLPSIFPASRYCPVSQILHMRWPKYWGFSFQHESFQWIFRVDFLNDWLVWSNYSPRNLKSLVKHHNLKASILWHSAFFMVQISHYY